MTPEAVRAFFQEHNIRTVEIGFSDMHGILRGKRLAAPYFLEKMQSGFAFAKAVLCWDLQCGIFPEYPGQEWTTFDTGYADFKAVPDLATLCKVPWRERTALVLCDLYEHGDYCTRSPRNLLRRAVQQAEGMGLVVHTASELEFYLLDRERKPVYQGLQTYSLNRGSDLEPMLEEARLSLEDMGIACEACNVEHGPAQVELNLGHAPALRAADNTLLFKYVIREIAKKHGYIASFMPKPFENESGNGFHVHQSLWDREQGINVFDADERLTRGYLAGLLQYMREFYVLGSPSINAYKRRKSYTFAPINVTWGGDNRTVAVRALTGAGKGSRLEQRCGAADANPYLITASNLVAGLAGIQVGLQPPAMIEGDAYAVAAPGLPTSLAEALDRFEGSEMAHKFFGTDFVRLFTGMGRHEIDLFNAAITDWEVNRYLEWA